METRRSFFRTASGLLLLPSLESFAGDKFLSAADPATSRPLRFVTLFFPNGVYPSAWNVKSQNNALQLDGSLKPLQRHAKDAVVVTGLNNPLGGHLGQTSGFLSGVDFDVDESGIVRGAKSLDQMLAQQFAAETFVPSLNLALEPPSQGGFGNRPRSYGNSISWSSPTNKIEPQINPQQAFDQVFFGQTNAGRQAAGRRKRIVDAVWREAKDVERRVSRSDRQRLSQYLDSISAVERKLQKSLSQQSQDWSTNPHTERPDRSGIPLDHTEYVETMMEIMVLSLQTDSTRVATLVLGHSISRIVYDFVDRSLNRNHHDFSHHRNDPNKVVGYNRITQWFSERCAWFLDRLKSIDEGSGSLLDNTVVLYGSGMKDGNVHDGVDIPIALFGNAGGAIKTNRVLDCPQKNTLLPQLHLSLLKLFGNEVESFNEVTTTPVSLS
ncbi:MAG: DUF1552 domain-containing protein [Planctomycetota bacterium]